MTGVGAKGAPVRDPLFSLRLVEGLTKDFTPSRTSSNVCFIDQRLFYRDGFWHSTSSLVIFLCHFGPPTKCSLQTQSAPGQGGPQPPTRPLAAEASHSITCKAAAQKLQHHPPAPRD